MDIDFSEITYLTNPDANTLHADYQQFLLSLTGPTVIDIVGKNPKKCRVIATLLHGNEPSGLIALHRWLTEESTLPVPETNIRIIICSVEAASLLPLFSKRYLDGGKDINRCFGSDKTGTYYQRAQLITELISTVNPELVVDLHNTSGSGPAFAVSPVITPETLSLAAFFCNTMILSGIKLGALMEQSFACPILTIECGGRHDEQAHEVAFAGIAHLASCKNIAKCRQEKTVDIVYKPLRLKLKPHKSLSYSEHDEGFVGVTLKANIEQFNFGSATQGQMLGWLDEHGLDNLQLVNDENENVIDDYFTLRGNQLVCATHLRIFMATTVKAIARDDCLFYVVIANREPI